MLREESVSKFFNTPYNSSYSSQEALETQSYTPCSSCILQGQPISHSYHSDQCSFQQLSPRSCQTSLHESTLLLTISHLQSQGNPHGDCLCLEWQLGGDWKKEGRPLFLVSLSISKVGMEDNRNHVNLLKRQHYECTTAMIIDHWLTCNSFLCTLGEIITGFMSFTTLNFLLAHWYTKI